MNPQPSNELSIICACFFGFIFLYNFYQTYKHGPHINLNNDLINIGYIERDDVNIHVLPPPATAQINGQLYLDCVEALKAIGYKASSAKNKARDIFAMNNPSSIEEFLSLALKQ